jgi:hypothetical protein
MTIKQQIKVLEARLNFGYGMTGKPLSQKRIKQIKESIKQLKLKAG